MVGGQLLAVKRWWAAEGIRIRKAAVQKQQRGNNWMMTTTVPLLLLLLLHDDDSVAGRRGEGVVAVVALLLCRHQYRDPARMRRSLFVLLAPPPPAVLAVFPPPPPHRPHRRLPTVAFHSSFVYRRAVPRRSQTRPCRPGRPALRAPLCVKHLKEKQRELRILAVLFLVDVAWVRHHVLHRLNHKGVHEGIADLRVLQELRLDTETDRKVRIQTDTGDARAEDEERGMIRGGRSAQENRV